jgi:hypothetical protein
MIEISKLQETVGNRKWRLNNLYYVKDENGNKVLFKMNKVQEYLHDNLWFFNIVPKARQLGITTFFAILYLDQVLFSKNKTAGIIAHRQEDMKKIFKNKIKFAWDNLHPWLKAQIGEPDTNTANELIWTDAEGNTSTIFVSMTTRGGTVQFLHISEFGYICQRFPDKAEEIVTGAINSVHAGNMVSIESTAAGRMGYFYDFCMQAEKMQKEGRVLTELDWKLFFFPWWLDDRYVMPDADFVINSEEKAYFQSLKDKYKINLTEAQQRWYIKKKQLNRDKIFAEFPSTLEEAFSVSVEGAYYAKEMARVYSSNRITALPPAENVKVDTWWDLGVNDFMVIIFVQTVGSSIRFIDCYYNTGEGLKHYVEKLREKGYSYGKHIFPHDINVKDMSSGITRKQTLYELGLTNIIVAPKLGIEDGRERVRNIFPRFMFDEEKTMKIYDGLSNYRKEWDAKIGQFKDSATHDENSHFADAVRTGAVVWREEGMPVATAEENKELDQSFFG